MTFISIVIVIIIIYFIYNCYLEDYSKLKWYVGTTFSREAENVTELDSCYLRACHFPIIIPISVIMSSTFSI